MSDLVKRLDRNSGWRNEQWQCVTDPALLTEAAARITALETALAEARNAAFEEAAKVAGELEVSGKTTTMEWANCMAHARDIAQAIRDMKDRT